MVKSALIYVLFVFVPLFLPRLSTAASPTGSLEVSPVFQEIELLRPEETKKIVFSYKNNSQKPFTLEIFPIDFRQADRTGAINFLGTESGTFSYSLASFLSFESNILQLDPGQKKDFIVTVSNREDLSPGGHYAAVVARLTTDTPDAGQAQIAPSISSLILLRKVGGERFNLSLSDLEFPNSEIAFGYPGTITSLFNNQGNIHLVPFGTAEIRDIFGRMIYKGVINTASLRVFPETRRYIAIDMHKTAWSAPISLNTITVNGQDSLKKTKYAYKDTFLYINPVFMVILAVLIPVTVLTLRRLREKSKHTEKKK